MTSLGRKMSCAKSKDDSRREKRKSDNDCSDLVVCEHLSEDNFAYGNNMIVRAGEVGLFLGIVFGFFFLYSHVDKKLPLNVFFPCLQLFLTTLSRYVTSGDHHFAPEDVGALMDLAAAEECRAITRCQVEEVEECLGIM